MSIERISLGLHRISEGSEIYEIAGLTPTQRRELNRILREFCDTENITTNIPQDREPLLEL
jgi:hypothetical protein